MLEKFAHKLTNRPKRVVLIALLLLIPSLLGYIATGINYDILSYLPEDLESVQGERLLEEPFHMAATSMLVVEDMPAGYSNDLINEIKKVEGVSNAVWVSNLVGVQIPTEMIPESFREMFFNGDATMMIIQYENSAASEVTMDAIQEIRRLSNEKCFLAGFSVLIKDTKDLVTAELPLFIIVAIALALVAMALTLESWVLPLVLVANIGIAVIYNFGTNLFLGEISYITKAIAAVLQLGVTMDYSVFLYRRYEEEKLHTEDRSDAMARAVVAAFRSLAGSCLTTVAGFLALCFMRLTLGMDIGIVMAKGVLLGVVTVVLVLPALVLLLDGAIAKTKHKTLIPPTEGINRFAIKYRWPLIILAALLLVPAVYGQNNAHIYYKLDEGMPADMPFIIANEELKANFDMSASHFIIVRSDLSATEQNEMEKAIKELPGISSVLSFNSLLGSGIPDFFLPESLTGMLKTGGYQLIMVNSSYENASTQIGQQLQMIHDIVKTYDEGAFLTGEPAMTQDLIEVSDVDFRVTGYISIAAIFLIIAFVFKSISVPVVLVSLIELSIFINQGLPYFTGADVPFVAPTIINCIQLGATVDYAILMTTRFQEELRGGADRFEAARLAGSKSDASIITSMLVLFLATLGVSFVAKMDIIASICLMISRGALISGLTCIFLLPALLAVFEPVFNKTSLHWKDVPEAK